MFFNRNYYDVFYDKDLFLVCSYFVSLQIIIRRIEAMNSEHSSESTDYQQSTDVWSDRKSFAVRSPDRGVYFIFSDLFRLS
jgi:hypothetical protein